MCNTFMSMLFPVAVASFAAHGEIISGNGYPAEYIDFQEFQPEMLYIPGLDASLGAVYDFAGSGFTNYLMVASVEQPNRSFLFLESSNASGLLTRNYFTEGQSLLGNLGPNLPNSEVTLALENSGDFEYAGQNGEMLYFGFVVETDTGSGVERNYGFLQLEHESELDYRVVGWAYETEFDQDITTFNLPAPSGLALLGLSGLAATRRRR